MATYQLSMPSNALHMTSVPSMEFIAARDLDEALDAKAAAPSSEFLAGGTDLMVEVNLAHHRPDSVISLRRVDELRDAQPNRIGGRHDMGRTRARHVGGAGRGRQNRRLSTDPGHRDDWWQRRHCKPRWRWPALDCCR